MRLKTFFIILSLVANVTLAIGLFTGMKSGRADSNAVVETPAAVVQPSVALRVALARGNYGAMRAAGVSEGVAREIALGAGYAAYRTKVRAAYLPQAVDSLYWKKRVQIRLPIISAERAAITEAEREFSDLLASLLGEGASLNAPSDLRLSFLPAWKQEQVRRIREDYEAIKGDLAPDAYFLPLPSDRETTKRLEEEEGRDLAALLSPSEKEELELRSSQRATNLLTWYGQGLETEADWRTVYAANKAHQEKFSSDVFSISSGRNEDVLASLADTRSMYEQLHQSLGDERFTALQRAVDSDRRDLDSLAHRLNLPADTTEHVLSLREDYALKSNQIAHDSTLDASQRAAQISALGMKAKAEVADLVGSDGADAYARRPNWIRRLNSGRAFTSDPAASGLGPFAILFNRANP